MVFQPPVKGQNDWTTLLSFDTVEHLEAWLVSEEREQLLKELANYADAVRQWRVPSSFPGWIPPAPADSALRFENEILMVKSPAFSNR